MAVADPPATSFNVCYQLLDLRFEFRALGRVCNLLIDGTHLLSKERDLLGRSAVRTERHLVAHLRRCMLHAEGPARLHTVANLGQMNMAPLPADIALACGVGCHAVSPFPSTPLIDRRRRKAPVRQNGSSHAQAARSTDVRLYFDLAG